jgi:hypothetical protein
MPNLGPEFRCLGTDPKRYTDAPTTGRPRCPQAGPSLCRGFLPQIMASRCPSISSHLLIETRIPHRRTYLSRMPDGA